MRLAVTGAGGFVGRKLVQTWREGVEGFGPITRLVVADSRLPSFGDAAGLHAVEGDLADAEIRRRIIGDGVDVLIHLAAVPGGAAEADAALSRRVNLDATLSLFEAAAAASAKPRILYTSTIAVFGAKLPELVDDDTPFGPELTYGAHKLMVEVALADMTRRGEIDGMAVRLPGIVARPGGASGLRSAFMSDVFHALLAERSFVSPVSPGATMWMMSLGQCADNLVHAAKVSAELLPQRRVATLPALRLSMADLVTVIAQAVGADPDLVSYAPDAGLEALFGDYPLLETPAANRAGFRHDGDVRALVDRALADIGPHRKVEGGPK
jgi:nucleoside-diphosphate-sugar epimerase